MLPPLGASPQTRAAPTGAGLVRSSRCMRTPPRAGMLACTSPTSARLVWSRPMTVAVMIAALVGAVFGFGADRLSSRWPEHEDEMVRGLDWRTVAVVVGGAVAFGLLAWRWTEPARPGRAGHLRGRAHRAAGHRPRPEAAARPHHLPLDGLRPGPHGAGPQSRCSQARHRCCSRMATWAPSSRRSRLRPCWRSPTASSVAPWAWVTSSWP